MVRRYSFCLALALIIGLQLINADGKLSAATINVPADFATIQEGVDNALSGDTVKVAQGAYFESVTMKAGVAIVGSGVELTLISASTNYAVKGADGVVIDGFTITSTGGNGVLCDEGATTIKNCIIKDTSGSCINLTSGSTITTIAGNRILNSGREGIFTERNTKNTATITNNIIRDSLYSGIYISSPGVIKNNIIIGSLGRDSTHFDISKGGIIVDDPQVEIINNTISFNIGEIFWVMHGIKVSSFKVIKNNIITFNKNSGINSGTNNISFNDIFGNGNNTITGVFGISEDPLFADAENGDYRLQSSSPCIDVGDTGIFDPDGTRSDMGAYGGPGALVSSSAATVKGKATVTDAVLTPSTIKQGETFSIRAKITVTP